VRPENFSTNKSYLENSLSPAGNDCRLPGLCAINGQRKGQRTALCQKLAQVSGQTKKQEVPKARIGFPTPETS